MADKLLTISEAAKLMCVCENTLRDWDIEKKFKASRTAGGHRRYTIDQIREYLEENPLKESNKLIGSLPDGPLKEMVQKWESSGHLDECESDAEKRNLAVLLESCRKYSECSVVDIDPIFSSNQILWLTQQGWLRSKLKKIISVQPLSGPCGLVFYIHEKFRGRQISKVMESEAIAAKTKQYNFTVFRKANFDTVKELYADAIASGIDTHIFETMPNRCNLETLVDATITSDISLKNTYDYIVGHEDLLDILEKREASEGVDLFRMPVELDPETFTPLAIAGRYPQNMFDLPIFSPYIVVNEGACAKDIGKVYMRGGWYDGESLEKPTIDISTGLKIEPVDISMSLKIEPEPGTVITN